MRRGAALLALAVVAALAPAAAPRADAQPAGRFAQPPARPPWRGRAEPPPIVATPVGTSKDLRAHVGAEMAARLLRSSETDEVLRGVQRAAELGTPQAIALLVGAVDASGAPGAAHDPRVLVEAARGLARATDQPAARAALVSIVARPAPPRAARDSEDPDAPARLELARAIAAIALASSGEPHAAEQLFPLARGGGAGQAAAAAALTAFPPATPGSTAGASTPQALRLAAALGDLRSVEIARAALRSSDPAVRAAALSTLGELGDTRAVDAARAAFSERDPRVRAASAEALVALDAPDAPRMVEALLADDATALAGARLAERAQDAQVARALAARALATPDPQIRAAAIAALGRGASPDAVRALAQLMAMPIAQADAANALARSPHPDAARALEAAAAKPPTLRLAIRAYVVRALVRGERTSALDASAARLARAADAGERAVGVLARVALGDAGAADFLGDRDARVRRAAAMGALARLDAGAARALLARRAAEPDDATRVVLGAGLIGGDPDARVTTGALVDRAESGAPDAPLAAMALARRGDAAREDKVAALLASEDPVMRAHVARGLAASPAPSATGRLAEAWRYETDATARLAMIEALAARAADAGSPSRREALDTSARLDPDARIRWIAARALGRPARGAPSPSPAALASPAAPPRVEVAWLRLATSDGAPPAAPPYTAALVRSDGLAVPIAFDDDGFALVPGVPPGDSRLVLAPRVPSYEPSPR